MIEMNSDKAYNNIISGDYGSVLLVSPYLYKKVPLGLIKLYTYYKTFAKYPPLYIDYVLGRLNYNDRDYDVIFITSGEFSYYHDLVIKTIKYYRKEFPKSKIVVGGVYAIGSEDFSTQVNELGADVIRTNLDKLDNSLTHLDYSLFPWSPTTTIFTTRGCKIGCKFCSVKRIEPTAYELSYNIIRQQIFSSSQRIIEITDNNILCFSTAHFELVIDMLLKSKKKVIFDNGFDCRLFNIKIYDLMGELISSGQFVKFGIRLAFDSTDSQDGKLQTAIKALSKNFPAEHILVYVLANFSDIDDVKYRANEVAKLGAYPYIQYYAPISWKNLPNEYKGKFFNPETLILLEYYNSMAYKSIQYDKFLKNKRS